MIMVIVVKVERYGFTLPECIQKGGDGIANSVDPDQTAPRSSLFWFCTVCSDLSVQILRTFMVHCLLTEISIQNTVNENIHHLELQMDPSK